jgi:hypothetical protein
MNNPRPNVPKFNPGQRPADSRLSSEIPQEKIDAQRKFRESMSNAPMAAPVVPAAVIPAKNPIPREEVTPVDAEGKILDSSFERIDLPSGFVFYDWSEISVKRFEPMDQAKLARAVRHRNLSLVLDVLSSTSNRDARDLSIGDFRALCLWHRLNSYMNTSVNLEWLSRYGNKIKTTIKNTHDKVTHLKSTREEYLEFKQKGFSVPTARDLETIEGNEIDEDTMYLFDRAQFIDLDTVKDRIEELKKKGDRIASVTARVEKLNELGKGNRFSIFEELDDFAEKYQTFGVQEFATITDENFDPQKAIAFLRDVADEASIKEAERIEAAIAAGVTPTALPEEVPLTFSLWNMFPYC